MQPRAIVIGSDGTIGSVIVDQLGSKYEVYRISRASCDYSESALQAQSEYLMKQGKFSKIICTIGVLHDDVVNPEKRIKELDQNKLMHYFYINSVLPTLCIKHFHNLLDKSSSSTFACLSAMVGSTKDNQLGGWYGYRASKAALNSLVKTASIELTRTHKSSSLIAIHPGTTIGDLSAPFAKNVKPGKYYTPSQSAQRILAVMNSVSPNQSGSFFNWDGQLLDW